MKRYPLSIWIGVNLIMTATFFYVIVTVRFQSGHSRVQNEVGERSAPTLDVGGSLRNNTFVDLREKLTSHRHHVISQLRLSLLQYKSQFPTKIRSRKKTNSELGNGELLCSLKAALRKSNFKFLTSKSRVFKDRDTLLNSDPFRSKHYKSCAIVSSAGALLHSNLGKFIDGHDYVVRFNNAPTVGFEEDVGAKTSLRILNSQILSKPAFHFYNSSLYENVSIAVWDPSNYLSPIEEWIHKPDFPFFDIFFARRKSNPRESLNLLDPRGLWDLWDYLSIHSSLPIPPNPPSSGFIGLALMLQYCDYVDMFEYVPSFRMTKRCHYYDEHEDLGCTMGDWHPLAAEKLLVLSLNSAEDSTVFDQGYVRISGLNDIRC